MKETIWSTFGQAKGKLRIAFLSILGIVGFVVGLLSPSTPITPQKRGVKLFQTRLGTNVYIPEIPSEIIDYGVLEGVSVSSYGPDGYRDKLVKARKAYSIAGVIYIEDPIMWECRGKEILSVIKSDLAIYDGDLTLKGDTHGVKEGSKKRLFESYE
jgi:hypothetical protein